MKNRFKVFLNLHWKNITNSLRIKFTQRTQNKRGNSLVNIIDLFIGIIRFLLYIFPFLILSSHPSFPSCACPLFFYLKTNERKFPFFLILRSKFICIFSHFSFLHSMRVGTLNCYFSMSCGCWLVVIEVVLVVSCRGWESNRERANKK